jgi:hypothetical protein
VSAPMTTAPSPLIAWLLEHPEQAVPTAGDSIAVCGVVIDDGDAGSVVTRAILRAPTVGPAAHWLARRLTVPRLEALTAAPIVLPEDARAATPYQRHAAIGKADRRAIDALCAEGRLLVADFSLTADQANLVLAGTERLRLTPGVGQPVEPSNARRVLFGVAGWNDWRIEWRGDAPAEWTVIAGFAGELARRVDHLLER